MTSGFLKFRTSIATFALLIVCPLTMISAAAPAWAQSLPAATSAGTSGVDDIFADRPCLRSKYFTRFEQPLTHLSQMLMEQRPIKIVAIGSSSTAGAGASSEAFHYPERLARQLQQSYPHSTITMLNRGRNGDDTPSMMVRLQVNVIDEHPDLVLWQLGSNSVLRDEDISLTPAMVKDGIARIKSVGADVILVDPQYSPRMLAKSATADMVQLIRGVARAEHVALFPRFEVMRRWHDDQKLDFDKFVIADGLHLNDWGYSCFAHTLGDMITDTVARSNSDVTSPVSAMLR